MEELATGAEDWWARGFGAGAFLVAALALLWRFNEWRAERRLHLRVNGSAGGLIGTGQYQHLVRSTRVAYSRVVVDVVNIGRSPAWIESVGFREPVPLRERISEWWHNEIRDEDVDSRRRIMQLTPDAASGSGVLPSRLEPGQRLVVFVITGDLPTAEGIAKFYPFCEDAEGHIHRGKTDRHFRRLLRAASAKPRNTLVPPLSDFVPDGGIYRINGRLSVGTHTVVSGLTSLWKIPSFILIPIFTLIGGVLTGIPGIGLVFWLPIHAFLWALQSILKGSSRLWEDVPLLRLPLAAPGILISVLGFAFVSLTPGVNFSTKHRRAVIGAMCVAWPLSHIAYDLGETSLHLFQQSGDLPAE